MTLSDNALQSLPQRSVDVVHDRSAQHSPKCSPIRKGNRGSVSPVTVLPTLLGLTEPHSQAHVGETKVPAHGLNGRPASGTRTAILVVGQHCQ